MNMPASSDDQRRFADAAAHDDQRGEQNQRADAGRSAAMRVRPIDRPDCMMSRLSALDRQPEVAARGQAALAPQLDQDALAVGVVLQQRRAGD